MFVFVPILVLLVVLALAFWKYFTFKRALAFTLSFFAFGVPTWHITCTLIGLEATTNGRHALVDGLVVIVCGALVFILVREREPHWVPLDDLKRVNDLKRAGHDRRSIAHITGFGEERVMRLMADLLNRRLE